jgi:hypothetical protein
VEIRVGLLSTNNNRLPSTLLMNDSISGLNILKAGSLQPTPGRFIYIYKFLALSQQQKRIGTEIPCEPPWNLKPTFVRQD